MTKEELEKEAKEYGKKATAWLEDREPLDQRDIENAYLAGAEPREKRIVELKKENAELKADSSEWEKASDKWKSVYELTNQQLEMSNKVYNDNLDYSHHIEDQLAKAKDILRRLMENQPTPSSMYEEADLVGWREVNKEAEQFLSEVEK